MLSLTTFVLRPGLADEQMRVIATSGEWAAIQHSVSMTAAPDLCMLANMRSNIAFRYHDDLLELRIVNLSWSLPTDVSGNIDIAVGAFSKALPITDNTSNSVSATVSDDNGQAILAAMNKSTQMQVTLGKAKPLNVSLVGSTKAATAFKTCAGVKGGSSDSGSNPFQ